MILRYARTMTSLMVIMIVASIPVNEFTRMKAIMSIAMTAIAATTAKCVARHPMTTSWMDIIQSLGGAETVVLRAFAAAF